jgi:hypothetical protein
MQRLKESAVVGGEFISEHLLAELGPTTRLRDLKASRIAAYRERRLAAGSVRRKDKTGRPSRLSAARSACQAFRFGPRKDGKGNLKYRTTIHLSSVDTQNRP